MRLTREEILARRTALPTEEVELPELGGSIRIRLLTLAEVEDIKRVQKNAVDPIKIYVPIVEKSCVNDDGSQMWVGEDIKLIATLPWASLERIVEASMRLSKLTSDSESPKG